jgi:hypothetical protein
MTGWMRKILLGINNLDVDIEIDVDFKINLEPRVDFEVKCERSLTLNAA